MLKFKEDKPKGDIVGSILVLIVLMMLFHFFIIGPYIEKIITTDLSFVILLLLLFYFISGYYLRVNNRYKKIISHVENMPSRARIISISILLTWFIILPAVLFIFF